MVALERKLGRGLYTPSEAAWYARVQTQLLNRWLFSTGGNSVIEPDYGDNERCLSFMDFVQALAVREIRLKHGVALSTIRDAYQRARETYGVEFPFAMRHRTYIWREPEDSHGNRKRRSEERCELVIRLDNDSLVQLTGKERDNLLITQVAELYMRDITFDSVTQLAVAYRPLTIGEQSILMDPHRHFGQPIVEHCGYSAQALYDAYLAEGGVEAAAHAYGVDAADIELAIRYFDYLQPVTK